MLRGSSGGVGRSAREWIRTPKYADLKHKQDWRKDTYQYRLMGFGSGNWFFVVLGLSAIG